jgi:hypothetical protein
MWTIRQEQVNDFRASCQARALAQRVQAIKDRIEEIKPEAVDLRSEEQKVATIRETVVAASKVGILDFDDQYEWALRRFSTGRNFWDDRHLRQVLADDLIHPKAKARYVLLLTPAHCSSNTVSK